MLRTTMPRGAMTAPRPTKSTFPASWKAWRKLRPGETIRADDRVLTAYVITKSGVIQKVQSERMGLTHVDEIIQEPNTGKNFPAGWYYRRINRTKKA
jgi:hypothetical protein